jgi:putative transposase
MLKPKVIKKSAVKPSFNNDLLDSLIKQYDDPMDIFRQDGLMMQFKQAIVERMLNGELTTELGYEKNDPAGNNSGNSRNGYTEKRLKCNDGDLPIKVPRDRNGDYEPKIIPKNQTRFDDMDDKIISLYARGMTTRDIQAQLKDLYHVDVSATLISNVTDEVIDAVKSWQSRPLDKIYPIVYMDALVIKVQQDKRVINKAFYLALGVNTEGKKEFLGIWISENEGAKFWLNVLTEIKNRGVSDIFISCVDGLTGFPEAIETVFPKTKVQLCIVHMVRNSLRYVGWKERKAVAADLRAIYTADTLDAAELALMSFCEKWDKTFPSISKSWQTHWEHITPIFSYSKEIRKVIYTTNAIESVNGSLRKVIKNKRVFPSDNAALKLLYLALENISKRWTMSLRNWNEAMNQFSIMYDDRLN